MGVSIGSCGVQVGVVGKTLDMARPLRGGSSGACCAKAGGTP